MGVVLELVHLCVITVRALHWRRNRSWVLATLVCNLGPFQHCLDEVKELSPIRHQ